MHALAPVRAQELVRFLLGYPEEPIRSGLRRATPGVFGNSSPDTTSAEGVPRIDSWEKKPANLGRR
jgi:hypothetical protein